MITSMRRFGWAGLFVGLVLCWGSTSLAQEKTPFPTLSEKHVYVSGVPDRYSALEAQINQLERSSPQSYYVVVVKKSGEGRTAATRYAKELSEHWRSQAAKTRLSFDAGRSVIVVLDVENKQVALQAGPVLSRQFGLSEAKIERDLIDGVFIPYALKDQYPEGLAALLNQTNDAIAERDHDTARVPVKITASGSSKIPVPRTTASSKVPAKATVAPVVQRESPSQAVAQQAPALPVRALSDWMSGLAVVVPIVLAVLLMIVGALWWGYRRTRSRLGGRIKEVRSKAVDVMDHLDALKERLKLLPTSPEFREPMAGETQALYQSAKQKNDKLWDGWLLIMEALDKAQKMADRSGSLFSQKTLSEAEKLIEERGSFQEIENQAQEIAKAIDRLDRAHPAARAVLEAIKAARPKLTAGLEALTKIDLPTEPYQGELDSLDSGTAQAGAQMVADPLGTQHVLEDLVAKSDGLLARIARVASLSADAGGVKLTVEAIRKQVAAHRAQGLKLVESGGNPDAALSQGQAIQAEILAALRNGDPEAGAQKLSEAQARIQEAQATIEQVQKARSFCDRDPVARLRESDRLRTAMSQAETYQADLERDSAPRPGAAWRGTSSRPMPCWRHSIARCRMPPRLPRAPARNT